MEEKIAKIMERNRRVELDKAWELSFIRRSIIAVITYIVAVAWLYLIRNSRPFLNALVPFGGYIFSTLSLPFVKKWWISRKTGL